MTLRVEAEGDEALRFSGPPVEVLRLHRALMAGAPREVLDWIHAPDSVLVLFDGTATTAAAVETAVREQGDGGEAMRPRRFALPFRPGGPDLAAVAADPGALVERLVATEFEVAAVGGNGLPLLRADGWDLDVPRLPSPRTRVPAGSVGLAGDRVCVYPVAMPGGWRLVGRTDPALVDVRAAEPVPWAAGDLVRFVPWTSV